MYKCDRCYNRLEKGEIPACIEICSENVQTIYVSPVPFDQLNSTIEKGKGKPHLGQVKNMMADGTNLSRAMLIAPLAGLAAAFGKFYLSSKEDK